MSGRRGTEQTPDRRQQSLYPGDLSQSCAIPGANHSLIQILSHGKDFKKHTFPKSIKKESMQIMESKTGNQITGKGKHSFLLKSLVFAAGSIGSFLPGCWPERGTAWPRVICSSWVSLKRSWFHFSHSLWPWETPPTKIEISKRDLGRNDSFWVLSVHMWQWQAAFESAQNFYIKHIYSMRGLGQAAWICVLARLFNNYVTLWQLGEINGMMHGKWWP